MKYLITFVFLVGSALLAGRIALGGRNLQPGPESKHTPVVVELFTSEGCSSCPPADALLKKLEQQQSVGSAEIIALEEHVDYWNSLGWADPFSAAQFTRRQEQYAYELRLQGPYTPQMIVDGRSEFVGSSSRQARQEIEGASRNDKAAVEINLKAAGTDRAEDISVRVGKLSSTTSGDTPEVWMAVTESQLHSAVTGGENRGEDLQHASIVRRLQKLGDAKSAGDFSFSADTNLKLDANWKSDNMRVAVFVQEKKSRRILAAGSTALSR
jgi:hypothetical protein